MVRKAKPDSLEKQTVRTEARTKARTKGGVVHSSVARSLRKLGADIAVARRVRRISTTDLAERMGVTRGTLRRLENGDPGVSLNTLAMAMAALGTSGRLTDLMDQASDDIGLMTTRAALPERIASRRPAKTAGSPEDATGSPEAPTKASGTPVGW